jgi:hypothetical protein
MSEVGIQSIEEVGMKVLEESDFKHKKYQGTSGWLATSK